MEELKNTVEEPVIREELLIVPELHVAGKTLLKLINDFKQRSELVEWLEQKDDAGVTEIFEQLLNEQGMKYTVNKLNGRPGSHPITITIQLKPQRSPFKTLQSYKTYEESIKHGMILILGIICSIYLEYEHAKLDNTTSKE